MSSDPRFKHERILTVLSIILFGALMFAQGSLKWGSARIAIWLLAGACLTVAMLYLSKARW
jgi:ABC-type uncharacterized transport system permease subunit